MKDKEQTPIRKLIDEYIEPDWEGAYNAAYKEALEKDIQEIINAKVLEAINSTIETMEDWSRSMREGHNIPLYRIEDEVERLENLKRR